MNKKLLISTLIALLLNSMAYAQDIVNLRMDAQWQGLRGNVASMDEDILIKKDYFRDDWPERKWFRQDLRNCLQEDHGRMLTFNNMGRMTSITYTQRGVAGRKTTCSYASNGLLSSFTGEGYKVQASYKGTTADINIYAETKDYKKANNLSDADLNHTPYRNTYPFDMKCRQTLTNDGLILTSNYYYVDSTLARSCAYTYNYRNQLTDEVITDYSTNGDEPKTTQVKYEYDNKDQLYRKTVKNSNQNDIYTYIRNEYGDCTELTIERIYGNIVYTYEYQYDSIGNWTMRLQFKNGAFDCAALRTLTYHKHGVTAADAIALNSKKKTDEQITSADEESTVKKQKESSKKGFSLIKKRKNKDADSAIVDNNDTKASTDKTNKVSTDTTSTKSSHKGLWGKLKRSDKKQQSDKTTVQTDNQAKTESVDNSNQKVKQKKVKKQKQESTPEKAKARKEIRKKQAQVEQNENLPTELSTAKTKSNKSRVKKVKESKKTTAKKETVSTNDKQKVKEEKSLQKEHKKDSKAAAKTKEKAARKAAKEAKKAEE